MAPRRLLIVAATEDVYSMDASAIVDSARPAYRAVGAEANLEYQQYKGGHALTPERHALIVAWMLQRAEEAARRTI